MTDNIKILVRDMRFRNFRLDNEAADALVHQSDQITDLERDLAFQKAVTDSARTMQAELLARAERAEAQIATVSAGQLSDGQRRSLQAAIRWAEAAGHTPIVADLKSLIVAGVAVGESS